MIEYNILCNKIWEKLHYFRDKNNNLDPDYIYLGLLQQNIVRNNYREKMVFHNNLEEKIETAFGVRIIWVMEEDHIGLGLEE